MSRFLIKDPTIINEGKVFIGAVLVEDGCIKAVFEGDTPSLSENIEIVDGRGKYLVPGMIDDQVHFREPGLTHKACIKTESRAAVAGGITSFMEMPNTVPQTLTQDLLAAKFDLGAKDAMANYSFFMGASNNNLDEVLATDPNHVCGIKVFMGSSTGDMLVDNPVTLDELWKRSHMLIATHCEDEDTVRANMAAAVSKYGEDIPMQQHPIIRSREACYKSSSMAVALAKKHGTRLHILHISTAEECDLFDNTLPLEDKRITAEACVHHLWFTDADYASKGSHIKWNPAVKTEADREAIWRAVLDNRIDIIATDHAPHTIEEKSNKYATAPSGGPLVQHAVVSLLEAVKHGRLTLAQMVEKMAHSPARCFQIKNKGYIREGYDADLVLIDPNAPWTVSKSNIHYQCGWSPFEGERFSSSILKTWIHGTLAYDQGRFNESVRGRALEFSR